MFAARRFLFVILATAICSQAGSEDKRPAAVAKPPRVVVTAPASKPAPGTSRVWAIFGYDAEEGGAGHGGTRYSWLKAINLGSSAASVRVFVMDHLGGAQPAASELATRALRSLRPGQVAFAWLNPNSGSGGFAGEFWIIVESSTPISVAGGYGTFLPDKAGDPVSSNFSTSFSTVNVPVDCEHPTGVERVCDFLAAAR